MAAFYSTSKFANWVVFECPLFEKELRAYLPLADFLRHRVYRTIERRYRLTAADRCTFVSCRSPRFFRTPAFLEAHCTVLVNACPAGLAVQSAIFGFCVKKYYLNIEVNRVFQ